MRKSVKYLNLLRDDVHKYQQAMDFDWNQVEIDNGFLQGLGVDELRALTDVELSDIFKDVRRNLKAYAKAVDEIERVSKLYKDFF